MGAEKTIGEADELQRYALTVEDFLTYDRARVFAHGYAAPDVIPFGARVVSKKVPEIALDTSAFG